MQSLLLELFPQHIRVEQALWARESPQVELPALSCEVQGMHGNDEC